MGIQLPVRLHLINEFYHFSASRRSMHFGTHAMWSEINTIDERGCEGNGEWKMCATLLLVLLLSLFGYLNALSVSSAHLRACLAGTAHIRMNPRGEYLAALIGVDSHELHVKGESVHELVHWARIRCMSVCSE